MRAASGPSTCSASISPSPWSLERPRHRVVGITARPACCQSTSEAHARSSGRARPSGPAIWKERVEGPRMVRRINIDGDDQADRPRTAASTAPSSSTRSTPTATGSASSAATTSRRAVRRELHGRGARRRRGVHRRPLSHRPGAVRGHPAARHVLSRRHPHGRARDAVAARRAPPPGLLPPRARGGAVEAGAEIVKVADGPERLTVAQVDALLYLPDKPRALLERALRVPALSEGWQGSFRELLAKGRDRGRARLERLPVTPRRRDPPRERRHQLVRARAGRRRRGDARRGARAVPHAAGAAGSRRSGADPQLLAVDRARRARVPDQRQARGRREPVSARPREGRGRARRRRAARRLRPAGRGAARSC